MSGRRRGTIVIDRHLDRQAVERGLSAQFDAKPTRTTCATFTYCCDGRHRARGSSTRAR